MCVCTLSVCVVSSSFFKIFILFDLQSIFVGNVDVIKDFEKSSAGLPAIKLTPNKCALLNVYVDSVCTSRVAS